MARISRTSFLIVASLATVVESALAPVSLAAMPGDKSIIAASNGPASGLETVWTVRDIKAAADITPTLVMERKPIENKNPTRPRPRPTPYKCLALAQDIGASRVWWGHHVGVRQLRDDDDLFGWGPTKESFDAIGCFRTQKDCENWLYWKRTDYPEFHFIRPCRRGL